MTEIDVAEEAKKSLGKVIVAEAMQLADIYCQLEFLLKDLKTLPPKSEDLEKMATTVFIQLSKQKNMRTYAENQSAAATNENDEHPEPEPAPAKPTKGKPADKDCPGCGRELSPTWSTNKKVWYFQCGECDSFINKDGSMTKRKPRKNQ